MTDKNDKQVHEIRFYYFITHTEKTVTEFKSFPSFLWKQIFIIKKIATNGVSQIILVFAKLTILLSLSTHCLAYRIIQTTHV